MPFTHIIAIPMLILLALSLGFQAARLRGRARAGDADQSSRWVSLKPLGWTTVLVIAFTLILTEHAVLPSPWLQIAVLTVAPLMIGYVAGLIVSTRDKKTTS
ncbi:MAG: hypothetical protein QM677_01695 [Microbacterium sp.]